MIRPGGFGVGASARATMVALVLLLAIVPGREAHAQEASEASWPLYAQGLLVGAGSGIALGHVMGGYAQLSQGLVTIGSATIFGLVAANRVPARARNEAALGALAGGLLVGGALGRLTGQEHERLGRIAHGIAGGVVGMIAGGAVGVLLADEDPGGAGATFSFTVPF